MKRWMVYQRERFPLAGHGPLIAAFSCLGGLLLLARSRP